MNSDQLKQLADISDEMDMHLFMSWNESLSGGNIEESEKRFNDFEKCLKKLNALVERFHMDNENEVTSERVQP